MFGTITVYSLIYVILQHRVQQESNRLSTSMMLPLVTPGTVDTNTISRAGRYMIIYPTIYVLCTLPLAAGRMAAMSGREIPLWYYCMAGSAITSCGWLDVVLYAYTRRVLVFSDLPPPVDEFGLHTFGGSLQMNQARTVIEGGLLVDPTISTRRRRSRNSSRSRSRVGRRQVHSAVMDDTFGVAMPGVITTKTTLHVATEPVAGYRSTNELGGMGRRGTTCSIESSMTNSEKGMVSRNRRDKDQHNDYVEMVNMKRP